MTALLAPDLLTGPAPPANAVPGKQSSGARSASDADPAAPFATLLTAADAALQASGDSSPPPPGGAPVKQTPETATDPADLLAALTALLRGTTDAAGATGDEAAPLLDRLAEVGDKLEDSALGPDGSGGTDALEALMAYLVMAPHTPADPATTPGLAEDVRALVQALAAQGATEGTEAASGSVAAGDAAQAESPAAALIAGDAEQAAAQAVTQDAAAVPAPAASAQDAALVGGSAPGTPDAGIASEAASAVAVQAASGADADGASTDGRGSQDQQSGSATAAQVSAQGNEVAAGAAATAAPQGPVAVGSVTSDQVRVVDSAALPSAVADSVQSAVLTGDSEVRLLLNPPDLGHLDVKISTHEGALQIRVEASQAAARELLDRALPALQQALEARDLRVDRLEVRQADTGRGSLDTSGSGEHSGSGERHDEGRPDWSPVAGFEPAQTPINTKQSRAADGRIDVLA